MIFELADTTGAEATISRDTYPLNRAKNYETVIVREGKTAIDAEINEMQDVWLRERLELTRDTMREGVLAGDVFGDGIVRNSYNVTFDGVNIHIGAGRARWAQRRCDLAADLSSGTPGYAISGFSVAAGIGNFKYIYVDVFRREYYGDPLGMDTFATDSVPGNDTALADPAINLELARRIQWYQPRTDIKATALNTAIPVALTGHSLFPIARVYRDGANAIQVQDLRVFGGSKGQVSVAEFIVRQSGTVGIDCTHTDFMTAFTEALALSPTYRVAIYLINGGTWALTGSITIPNNISIIGRTPTSHSAVLSKPTLTITSVNPAVFTAFRSTLTGVNIVNSGTGPALTVFGAGCYVDNVTCSSAGAYAFTVNPSLGDIRILNSDLGACNFQGTTTGINHVYNCIVRGVSRILDGWDFHDCTFSVTSILGGGSRFYSCEFLTNFSWTLAFATSMYSCDLTNANLTIIGDDGSDGLTAIGCAFATLTFDVGNHTFQDCKSQSDWSSSSPVGRLNLYMASCKIGNLTILKTDGSDQILELMNSTLNSFSYIANAVLTYVDFKILGCQFFGSFGASLWSGVNIANVATISKCNVIGAFGIATKEMHASIDSVNSFHDQVVITTYGDGNTLANNGPVTIFSNCKFNNLDSYQGSEGNVAIESCSFNRPPVLAGGHILAAYPTGPATGGTFNVHNSSITCLNTTTIGFENAGQATGTILMRFSNCYIEVGQGSIGGSHVFVNQQILAGCIILMNCQIINRHVGGIAFGDGNIVLIDNCTVRATTLIDGGGSLAAYSPTLFAVSNVSP